MPEILLCRPCAEQAQVAKQAKIITSTSDKCTCAHCGRRRFGYICKEQGETTKGK